MTVRLPVDVGRVGLGCAALGNLYSGLDDDQAIETVDAAWGRGVRFFDTAPLYGHGLSESRLGRALATRPREEFVLATKVGRVLVESDGVDPDTIFADVPAARPEFDFSADGIARSLESSLERLGVDRLDIVHVHDPDDHLDQAVNEAYPALARWQDEGVVASVGIGTNHASVAMSVLDRIDLDWVLLAGRYTLLDQSGAPELFPRCLERGAGVIAGGVFNSGLLADPEFRAPFHYATPDDDVVARARELGQRCSRHGVDLPAAALQFPGRHPVVDITLVGPRSAAELHEDLDMLEVDLPDSLWNDLGVHAHR